MSQRYIPILFVAMLGVANCDNDDSSRTVNPPPPTTDELIIADCYVVRDALEAFAAENNGVFPYDLEDQSNAGNQFMTFLPGDAQLTNRYTGLATAPIFAVPQWPGEIGVIRYSETSGTANGYRVVGRGRYGELIQLENHSQLSHPTIDAYEVVFSNCATMIAALETFAAQAGRYPADLSEELTPGHTFVDLLPNNELLMNPFTGVRTEPEDGNWLGVAGAIGYLGLDHHGDGSIDSYIFDAYGADAFTPILIRTPRSPEEDAVHYSAVVLKYAAEEFASQNNGVYPNDLGIDTTPSGYTLLQIASYDYPNPYTGVSPFRNGLATSRGDVGYVPRMNGELVVGYTINAWGLFEEIERFEVSAE